MSDSGIPWIVVGFIGMMLLFPVFFLGILASLNFTLTGYCPAGVDAQGNCLPRHCDPGDRDCEANNIRMICMSQLDTKCPDITTIQTISFGSCDISYGLSCGHGCVTERVRMPNGDWSCKAPQVSQDGACYTRETAVCQQLYANYLAATPAPTQPGSTNTPTPTAYLTPTPVNSTPTPVPGQGTGSFTLLGQDFSISRLLGALMVFAAAYYLVLKRRSK